MSIEFYAEDTTIFLKEIVHLSEKFKLFSDFLRLKPNTSKCEIAGIAVLKGVQTAICGMRYNDLRNEAIKIFGIYFSWHQKINDEKKKKHNIISNIQGVQNLKNEKSYIRRIVVFKTLTISKIVLLALLTKTLYQVVKE